MTFQAQAPTKEEITTCQFPLGDSNTLCTASLGAESRELDYRLCREHRKCIICKEDLAPVHIRLCLETASRENEPLQVIHPRCNLLTSKTPLQDPEVVVKQSYIDSLNHARLMITPDMNLNQETNEQTAMLMNLRFTAEMTFEQLALHLKMMEACVAQTSITISRSGAKIKEVLKEVESKRAAKAKLEHATSSRPVNKPSDDAAEVVLAEFMRINGITERKIGMKIWRDRAKAIHSLMTVGLDEKNATASVDSELVKKGILRKVS